MQAVWRSSKIEQKTIVSCFSKFFPECSESVLNTVTGIQRVNSFFKTLKHGSKPTFTVTKSVCVIFLNRPEKVDPETTSDKSGVK